MITHLERIKLIGLKSEEERPMAEEIKNDSARKVTGTRGESTRKTGDDVLHDNTIPLVGQTTSG